MFTQAKEQQATCHCWPQGKPFGVESQDPVMAATSPISAFRKRLVPFSPAKAERGRKELVVTGRWTSQKKRGATAAVSLRCAALSHPEVYEKPLSPAAPQAFSEEFISHMSPSPAFLGQVYSLLERGHIPLPLPFSLMPGPQCAW